MDTVKAYLKEDGQDLVVQFENLGNKAELRYKNISYKFPDQEVVMLKSGLLKLFGKKDPWGALTGVRPTKIIRKFLKLEFEYDEITDIVNRQVDTEANIIVGDTIDATLDGKIRVTVIATGFNKKKNQLNKKIE